MNRNQLKYFVAAAEHRSFTKAAEQFYLTQTAITQQIRLLEESLGCELFDRSTRPVRLTPAGQVFLAYTGWGGAVPVAENREIRQGKRYDFQREPSYGYSHLLL